MKNTKLLLLLLVLLPAQLMALTKSELDALNLLLLGPKPNVVKECFASALAINDDLVRMKFRQVSESEIESRLGQLLSQTGASKFKDELTLEWQKSQSSVDVSQGVLQSCLLEKRVDFEAAFDDATTVCLGAVAVTTASEARKEAGVKLEDALSGIYQEYKNLLSSDYINNIVETAYSNEPAVDNNYFHRLVFLGCIGK